MAKSVLLNFPPPWAPAAPSLSSSRRPLPTDADTELVLGLDVGAGNGSNGDAAAGLVSEVRDEVGLPVQEVAWDMAYGDGDTRTEVPTPRQRA